MKNSLLRKMCFINLGLAIIIAIAAFGAGVYNDEFDFLLNSGAVILLAGCLLTIILLFITNLIVLKKMINEPIDLLVSKVNTIQYGKYEPIELNTKGEISIITSAFNKMLQRLKIGYEREQINLEKLRQEEKINVIGELAAATTHEIRNPLTTIKGFTQLLQKRLTEDANSTNYTKVVLREIANMENVIKEFLFLVKPTFPELDRENINTILDEVLPTLAHRTVERRITIETEYQDEIPFSNIDREQIRQLFINIGTRTIENTQYGQKLFIKTVAEKANLIINFKSKSLRENNDEDGLHMAASYQIVDNHNGTLLVKTTKAGYTIYSIKLPLSP